MKPKTINIMGLTYEVKYVDRPSEVDIHERKSIWGQIDYWTRTIRIYQKGRSRNDIFATLLHEILEGLKQELDLKSLKKHHDELTRLSVGLADTLIRNKLVSL